MKKWAFLFVAVFVGTFSAAPAHAIVPPINDPASQLDENAAMTITSLHTAKGAGFIELHNQSAQPINLSQWVVRYSSSVSEVDVHLPGDWLLADNYVALSENGVVPGIFSFPQLSFAPDEPVQTVELIDANGNSSSKLLNLPADLVTKWYQRKSTGLSGVFTNDFSVATAATKLRHTPLYKNPATHTPLRIVEVYPHAASCAPNDSRIECGDYIKLFNPTSQPQSTGEYRLRSDSGSSLSGNAFHLDAYGSVPAGGYLNVRVRDDGTAMSLTDDGGYVWLEDAEGVERYDETIIQYPSASSTTKVGWAWAMSDTGEWQWTPTPSPTSANSFPIPGRGSGSEASASPTCPVGKYRNPETNRCRTVEEAINALAACDEGSERNPDTNRCRKMATLASATITPCEPDQERNPETNRCRKVAGTTTASLTPCKAGQERNPETNRCRNVASASGGASAITPPQESGVNMLTSLALGTVGVAAVGYGLFEWRTEIGTAVGRLVAAMGKK